MGYRKHYRAARPTPRGITVKYAGTCICCGGQIKAGESAMFYPAGTIAGVTESKIGHVGGLDGNSATCSAEIGRKMVQSYVSEGLGENIDFCPSDNS